jgi:microcystin-dependent protein
VSTPFIGELKILPFGFAPKGWAACNGQLLPINQNQALFSLLGTYYGGDGRTTFALPNLQGRVPASVGGGISIGQAGGEEKHTLASAEMPGHTHALAGTPASATTTVPSNNFLATASQNPYAASAASNVALASSALTAAGGGGAHENRQPYLTLNVCIALQGIFPTRN